MRARIAEVCARSGAALVVVEADATGAERCRDWIAASLQHAIRLGRLDEAATEQALAAVDGVTDLDGTATADLVIEAVPEIKSIKLDLFRRLDALLPPNTLLASLPPVEQLRAAA